MGHDAQSVVIQKVPVARSACAAPECRWIAYIVRPKRLGTTLKLRGYEKPSQFFPNASALQKNGESALSSDT